MIPVWVVTDPDILLTLSISQDPLEAHRKITIKTIPFPTYSLAIFCPTAPRVFS